MRTAERLSNTIRSNLGEIFGTKPRVLGQLVNPDDPKSLISLSKTMGEERFSVFMKEEIHEAVEYSAPSGFKLKEHTMERGKFDIEYQSEDDRGNPETLTFSFDEKKGYLEIAYWAEEFLGIIPATHLDPEEEKTREIYNEVHIFSATELKELLNKAMDIVIEPPEY